MFGGVIVGTIVFAVLYVVATIVINNYVQKDVNDPKIKAEYRTLTIGLTFLAVFCMWLMWVSVYMHQMNPLIVPLLEA